MSIIVKCSHTHPTPPPHIHTHRVESYLEQCVSSHLVAGLREVRCFAVIVRPCPYPGEVVWRSISTWLNTVSATHLSWLRFTVDLGLFFLLSALALSFMEAEGGCAVRGYVLRGGKCSEGYVQWGGGIES